MGNAIRHYYGGRKARRRHTLGFATEYLDGGIAMKTYITVRDVLDTARMFHKRLMELYDRLTRESEERTHG